ncbi:hypothetical protein [Streptomyces sp. LN245]|uniref:hypothetical protein n=1 Tax=Streptomyces sp. LN245 TaxID=3112975 RepID=UPI00371CD223
MTNLAGFPERPVRVNARIDSPLSRWLWLVKWILAIPHYVVIGFFLGGAQFGWWSGGLIGVLTVIAAVILAFTEKYPKPAVCVIGSRQHQFPHGIR